MPDEPGIFEIIYSTRAMRKLKPDPIPEDTLKKIVDAGIRCASGGNMQDWAFIIVQDTGRKRFIRDYYWNTWQQMRSGGTIASDDIPAPQQRMLNAAAHLAAHMDEAPALLLACTRDHYPPIAAMGNERASKIVVYGSIFPAVQNILLACRALGVGATLTTIHCFFEDQLKARRTTASVPSRTAPIHCFFEDQLKARLNIPDDMEVAALIPLGYPQGKFGPVTRKPVEEVMHWDEWGKTRA